MIPKGLQPILDETIELSERFRSAGKRLYLVGGTVRDATVGRIDTASTDIDLTTDALPEEIEKLLVGWADATWDQGKRFGTIGAKRHGRSFEITTHRAESYDETSRKPEVAFGDNINDDLSRRDFTVNAMALELPALELLDPFDGLSDLLAKRLRTPLDPHTSFSDDPLRMLRAARFVAAFSLEPSEELLEAVVALRGRLSIVSAERIRDELDKLISLPDPEAGLWFIARTGISGEFLPELGALELEQDPIHRHKDVLAHTIAVIGKTRPDRILRLAALFHDVGKPRTRAYRDGGVTFHHHDVVGARMTKVRMEALRYSAADIEAVSRLVELHLRFHTYRLGWTDSALRRYARDAGDLLGLLNELTRADCTTRNLNKARELERRIDELEERLAVLREKEELDAIRPELDGVQVMEILDLGPGRDVGRALEFLMEIRLDEGLLGSDEITRRLRAWWELERSSSGPR